MPSKITVGILFGGKSAEHEVSLQSAKNVYEAINKSKYTVKLIGIDKAGRWHLNDAEEFLLKTNNPELIKLQKISGNLALVPGEKIFQLVKTTNSQKIEKIDVIFPILHGPFGEDGTIQGLLKLANVPFVGASVLGSAVGMDKDVMKRLLRDAKIPIGKFLTYYQFQKKEIIFEDVIKNIGLPFYVKPANLGSSVGISRVDKKEKFSPAVNEAFKFDSKIIIEENMKGREIECSVLGNENPIASVPGEIITDSDHHKFYSYEAKYIDDKGANLQIPASLSIDVTKKIQELAVKTFKVLCCEGMARVDFFLSKKNHVFVNELNTIPGFTKISMYPKLWQASGISYSELIDRLIQLAISRFEKEKILKTTV